MERVAVVGLGRMGRRMAGRLLDAGYDVIVWNRSAEPSATLGRRGAGIAATPKEAAAAGVVIIIVSDSVALRAVTEGPNGVAAGAAASTTVIQMSTVGVEATRRLESMLRPDALLDAPVLGSIAEAEAGTLAIFVGGPASLLEKSRPVLDVLGRPIAVGGVGAGNAAKLVANLTLFAVVGALGEALALGDAVGLSRGVTFEVLTATPLSAQAERRRTAIESGEFPARFALSLAAKDADLILEAAGDTDLRLTKAARAWLGDARDAGWGERDYASLIEFILRSGG